MNKKFVRILLILSLLLLVSIFSFACNEPENVGHEHSFATNIVAPTCTEQGYTEHVCSCNLSYVTDIKPAKEHNFTKTITNPTCDRIGYSTYVCECGFSYVADTVSALGHDYRKTVTNPTCVDIGYTLFSCDCGFSYASNFVEKTAHQYVKSVVNPTCIDKGYTRYTCSCGDFYDTDIINRIPHVYDQTIIGPTCEADGYTIYLCACGDQYVSDIVSAHGHEYKSKIITQATCESQGERQFDCDICSDSYVEEYSLEALSPTEIFELIKKSSAEIYTYDKSGNNLKLGSAFVCGENGLFVTNFHILKGGYSGKIKYENNGYEITSVLAYDENIDIAVVKVNLFDLTPLPVCEHVHAEGSVVYSYGSSLGLTSTFAEGVITAKERVLSGVKYIQHDAPISRGNSGGPLVDSYGNVIGINTLFAKEAQNLNFAISIKYLDQLNFDNPTTMSELFIASDPLTKLKDYAVYNGQLQGGYCSVLMGASDNGFNVYSRALYYQESTGKILLSMAVQGVCEVGIFIERLNGQYTWVYMDVDGCQMSGIINAGEFNDSSLLDYKDVHNIADYKHASNVRNYATLLIQLLLISFDGDYANTGVTAGDLGFSNF